MPQEGALPGLQTDTTAAPPRGDADLRGIPPDNRTEPGFFATRAITGFFYFQRLRSLRMAGILLRTGSADSSAPPKALQFIMRDGLVVLGCERGACMLDETGLAIRGCAR